MRLLVFGFAALLLTSCQGAATQKKEAEVAAGGKASSKLDRNFIGDPEITIKNGDEKVLSVSCGKRDAMVYVDTLNPASSPPPLHGVFGRFKVDGKSLAPSELGWGGVPPSAWSIHDRNPVRPVARLIVAAHSVSFTPPEAFGDGNTIEWSIRLSDEDRAAITQACS